MAAKGTKAVPCEWSREPQVHSLDHSWTLQHMSLCDCCHLLIRDKRTGRWEIGWDCWSEDGSAGGGVDKKKADVGWFGNWRNGKRRGRGNSILWKPVCEVRDQQLVCLKRDAGCTRQEGERRVYLTCYADVTTDAGMSVRRVVAVDGMQL